MSDNLSYSSPYSQPNPAFPQQIRSSVPKVIGIIHIIYAALGIIGGISAFIISPYAKSMPMYPDADKETIVNVISALEKKLPYTYTNAGAVIILGALLMISGIKLLKYQASGLKLSNMWTVIRIVWLIIITAVSYKATIVYQEALMGASPEAAEMMKNFSIFGFIIGFVIIATYPVISYILLNREHVKKDLN